MPMDNPEDYSNLPPMEVQVQPPQPSRYQADYDKEFTKPYGQARAGMPVKTMKSNARVPGFNQ